MTKQKIQYWVIPPESNAEFVACMEDVLEIYSRPYNPAYPVLCMDEQPIQLLKETRKTIPASINHPRRVDYEYERAGTACIFMFAEPLAAWRDVSALPSRTKADWALEVKRLLNVHYSEAEKVILVCDNLNTHTKGAFYEVFAPKEARALIERLEFHYTPKHGSWLNIAECELSSLTRQCITGRRIADIDSLREETYAWATSCNQKQRDVDWQFTVENARTKLKTLYPKFVN